jgi:protease-4
MQKSLLAALLFVFTCGNLGIPGVLADDDAKDAVADAKAEKKADNKEKETPIKKLVEVRIDQFLVPARTINVPLPGRVKTLQELLDRFEKLADDDDVGAVLLNLDGLALSIPDVEELRDGLHRFKKSGKKVTAFLNSGDPMSYLLATAADEVAIAPCGNLILPGIGRVFPFMRGMYQMQGIEYEVITAGEFKYPGYVNRREPTKHFEEEMGAILDGMFADYVRFISEGRDLPEGKVKKIIDKALFEPEEAKNHGLVDVISYYDDYRDRILRRDKFKKSRGDGTDWAKITSLQDLVTQITKEIQKAQEGYKAVGPKLAVLNARGPIVDASLGAGFASQLIMRDEFVKTIEEIRKNKTIRAVVLRIDSPGGSAYASDIIWRKLKELDEEKPVVVSMGSVAASGGYYIACPGRLIFAESSTITGSIGVISMFATQASALNRSDINLAEMKRGKRSLLGSGHRDLQPDDRAVIKKFILDTYEMFLDRVAEGRKMPKDQVRKLAGGRVYPGSDALEIGLVDRIGTLKNAIDAARDMADIPPSAELKVVHYPRAASIGELAESLFGMSTMFEAVTKAQTPAGPFSFDSQVQYFSQTQKPLCWMAIPQLHVPSWNGHVRLQQQNLMEIMRGPTIDPIGVLHP